MLADLLGLRRETVTQAAPRLQAKGDVDYSLGHIFVRDRGGLERSACECYEQLVRS